MNKAELQKRIIFKKIQSIKKKQNKRKKIQRIHGTNRKQQKDGEFKSKHIDN